jgi:hypothetical protein
MSSVHAQARPTRMGFLFLLLTLTAAGLEIWGIGASLGSLLK